MFLCVSRGARRGKAHTHEQVICVWNIAADAEELHQVVELAVDIAAYLGMVSEKYTLECALAVVTVTGAVTVTTLPSSISSSRAL